MGAAEAVDRQDGGSGGEGHAHQGEGVRRAQEYLGSPAGPRGRGAAFDLPAEPPGQNTADEGHGQRAEYVPGTSQRVQVRDRTVEPGAHGGEKAVLRSQAAGAARPGPIAADG